jgi:hypothetical protein
VQILIWRTDFPISASCKKYPQAPGGAWGFLKSSLFLSKILNSPHFSGKKVPLLYILKSWAEERKTVPKEWIKFPAYFV